jgi:hypothetical protein
MLKKVIRPDGRPVEFRYDALGRRTAKQYFGKITRWVWDGNVPIHEWDYKATDMQPDEEESIPPKEPTKDITTWVFEAGTFVPTAKMQDGKQYSIVFDYLGTPIQMYNEQGDKTWDCTLDIYGKVLTVNKGSEFDCPFRWAGQYFDSETNLCYNRYRYYSPETGSYLSQDPIRLSGNNPTLYAYVHDPNTWLDPFGLECSAAQRKANKANGKKAEDLIYNKLSNNPNVEILGRQVTVHTEKGVRYVDVLIRNKKTGKIVAVEVKSGNAKRSGKQISKDDIINSGSGTFGENGFSDSNNPLIGTSTANTTTSVTQVPLWKI